MPQIVKCGAATDSAGWRIIAPGFAALIALAALFLCGAEARAGSAALVLNGNSGAILYSYNLDEPLHPASLTKIMTVYLAFEALREGRLKPRQNLAVSRKAARQRPSRLGLRRGKSIRIEDAILALITKSANDVSVVIAEAIDGSEAAFAKRMTERAQSLGMSHTVFHNASGLHHPDQLTTARDMAKLAIALIRDFPQEYRQFSTEIFTWRGRKYRNHNPLLPSYKGVDGVKTGYIRQSGYNLVTSAQRGDRRVIGVVLGSRDVGHRNWTMKTLLDYGFLRVGDGVYSATYPGLPYIANPSGGAALALALNSAGAPPPVIRRSPNPTVAYAPAPGGSQRKRQATTGAKNWAIQVGAYRDAPAAEEAAMIAADRIPALLGRSQVAVVPVTRGGQRMYRARLTGLSESDAREACLMLARRRIPCLAVADTGEFRTSSLPAKK